MLFDLNKLKTFPTLPGVYLMKDEAGNVLYIGKAKNIRTRVKQYFIAGRDGRLMIPYLIAKVSFIETIVVSSEKEALLLENNLIKQHKPRYNALLKDDKTYIALKIATKERWPRVQIVRYRGKPESNGLYFGPYTSAYAARQTLDLLNKLFPLRQCSNQELARRTRPCILFQMNRCSGPCADKCTKEEYDHHLSRTIQFLRGHDKEILKDLREEMERFSNDLEFEKAARVLKVIRQIEKTIEVQNVDRPLGFHGDSLGIHRNGEEVMLSQLLFREGKLVGSSHFDFSHIAEDDDELFTSFILQHYEEKINIPQELLLPIHLDDQRAIEDILSTRKGSKVHLLSPQKGEKKALLEMARINAEASFSSQKSKGAFNEKILEEMEEIFHLINYPSRIECFDNSHTSGSEPVSSMVAFTNGEKDSKRYRTYRLKIGPKPDDYAGMREVLKRRYQRAIEEDDLPDLIIIDGGKGHLRCAFQVLNDLNIHGIDLIGLAKEEGRHDKGMTSERVFLVEQKEPISLNKHSPILFYLQKIRDEAHRVALTFHRKKRSKNVISSALDNIPGIGPVKRRILLTHFGSLKNLKLADETSLNTVKGLSKSDVASIKAFLKNQP